jgi:surface antigen
MAAAGLSIGLAAQAGGGSGAQGRPSAQFEPEASFEQIGHERQLDEDDEIAALEAIRVALTDVADGVSYVWHRRYGELSGLVQPTQSFKAADGRLCRHIIVILSAEQRSGRIEGTACRLSSGRWQLEG